MSEVIFWILMLLGTLVWLGWALCQPTRAGLDAAQLKDWRRHNS